jgi:hypothetical protein
VIVIVSDCGVSVNEICILFCLLPNASVKLWYVQQTFRSRGPTLQSNCCYRVCRASTNSLLFTNVVGVHARNQTHLQNPNIIPTHNPKKHNPITLSSNTVDSLDCSVQLRWPELQHRRPSHAQRQPQTACSAHDRGRMEVAT